jgi:hypothetical protein
MGRSKDSLRSIWLVCPPCIKRAEEASAYVERFAVRSSQDDFDLRLQD